MNFEVSKITLQYSRRMTIIFFLIGISLTVALGFLGAFLWSVKTGQYEDSYTPSVRILFDENYGNNTNEKNSRSQD